MSWRSSYLLCPICFNVYVANQIAPMWQNGKPHMYCPSVTCVADRELVTIDELMITPIVKLNKKGYRTLYCCSGHEMREKEDREGYIMFYDKYKFPSLPEGWREDGPCIRSTTDDLALSIKNLNKWVDELPFFLKKEKGEKNDYKALRQVWK